MSRFKSLRERALKAIERPPEHGPDLDLSEYRIEEPGYVKEEKLSDLPSSVLEKAASVGIDVEESEVSGTYFQVDYEVVRRAVVERLRKRGVVVMSIIEALRKYDWVKDYYGRAVQVDTDKYTAVAELYLRHGYFIYVPPVVKVEEPIQACLFVSCNNIAQPVHNIIIVDEGSELNLVTGCVTMANKGLHVGVSEFYVKRNAKLTFTMIHGWAPRFDVRPRAAVIVEEGGTFIGYYVNLQNVKSLQAEPKIVLHRNSTSYYTNIIIGKGRSMIDIGAVLIFEGEGSRGELTSRSIIDDESTVIMRGTLMAKAPRVRGHLECKGLLLSDKARGEAIPVLNSLSKEAELTHEAALGRISEEELLYLMSRGFDEEEATSLIVRGFIDVGISNLPEKVRPSVISALDLISKLARG